MPEQLAPVVWLPSPNYNHDQNIPKRKLIIHDTEGGYQPSVDWLRRYYGSSSAHYVIREDGQHISQLVANEDIAWHAGNWGYNQESIGIEMTGWMSRGFGDELLRTTAKLAVILARRHNIPLDRNHIIGHGEVPYPNDHTDPGKDFQWDYFMGLVSDYAPDDSFDLLPRPGARVERSPDFKDDVTGKYVNAPFSNYYWTHDPWGVIGRPLGGMTGEIKSGYWVQQFEKGWMQVPVANNRPAGEVEFVTEI